MCVKGKATGLAADSAFTLLRSSPRSSGRRWPPSTVRADACASFVVPSKCKCLGISVSRAQLTQAPVNLQVASRAQQRQPRRRPPRRSRLPARALPLLPLLPRLRLALALRLRRLRRRQRRLARPPQRPSPPTRARLRLQLPLVPSPLASPASAP